MIRLTRLNGKEFILNCDFIKSIEATPDTVITLTQGEKLMVLEPVDAVVTATINFRRSLQQLPSQSQVENRGERKVEFGQVGRSDWTNSR